MNDAGDAQVMAEDKKFIELIGKLVKEALSLVCDEKRDGAELERILKDFIAGKPAESTTPLALVEQGEPRPALVATTAAELAIVSDTPAPTPAAEPAAPSPGGLSLEPVQPKPVREEIDLTRPDFGENQISSPEGLHAGMKLRVRGNPQATLECQRQDDMLVNVILNKNNPKGEVTLISAPYDDSVGGRKAVVLSYTGSNWRGKPLTLTSRVYLDNLSVTQFKPRQEGGHGSWRVDVWLERIPTTS